MLIIPFLLLFHFCLIFAASWLVKDTKAIPSVEACTVRPTRRWLRRRSALKKQHDLDLHWGHLKALCWVFRCWYIYSMAYRNEDSKSQTMDSEGWRDWPVRLVNVRKRDLASFFALVRSWRTTQNGLVSFGMYWWIYGYAGLQHSWLMVSNCFLVCHFEFWKKVL